jgi:hypothetical protein
MAEPTRTIGAGGLGPLSAREDTPTQQLSLAASGERCVNCGAPLASDQRYCINCGERRGKPRFEAVGSPAPVGEQVIATSAAAVPPRRTRTSAGFNLIAGVATLLLAMGVGVLIGHNNSAPSGRSATPATQVITVGGGAGTSAGSGAAATAGGGTGSGSHKGSKGKDAKGHAAATKAPPKVVVQKAAAAASKVTGGSAPVASPTVTQGGSCSPGQAGCQNGKFTGNNFFGQ